MFTSEQPSQHNYSNSLSQEERVRLDDIFREDLFGVDSAKVIHEGATLKGIFNVSWSEETGSGEDRSTIKKYRSLTYFDRPGFSTPAFTIVPKSGITGLFSGVLPGIELPDSPEFNKKFSVMSFFPNSTRSLLNKNLRQALIDWGGIVVKAGTDGRVAIYPQDGAFVYQGITQDFFRLAEKLANHIFDAAASLAPEDKPSGKEVVEAYKSSWVCDKSRMVTSDDVKTLLAQPHPREIPKVIWNQICRDNFMFGVMGVFFAVVGLVFAPIALVNKIPALQLISIGFILMGLAIAFFALPKSLSRKRTLRNGECRSMQVLEVKSKNIVVNGLPQYSVTVQAIPYPLQLNAAGIDAANLARKRQLHGQPIRVLVDPVSPLDPASMIWVESLAIDICIDSYNLDQLHLEFESHQHKTWSIH